MIALGWTRAELIDAISAIGQAGAAVAISIGVWVAFRQISSWREEKSALRRAELGEELVAVVSEVQAKLSSVRNPFGYGPPEGEDDDGTFDYRRRMTELQRLDDEFIALRRLAVRQRALIGSEAVNAEIKNVFEARGKLIAGLNGMIRHLRRDPVAFGRTDPERYHDRISRYEDAIWQGSADPDPIDALIDSAVTTIEAEMIPIIRLHK